MANHEDRHELAGQTVKVQFKGGHPQIPGSETEPQDFVLEDWQDRLMGKSWMWMDGNPAAMIYAIRTGMHRDEIPLDDEVVYGKIDGLGHMVHVSELVLEPANA